MEGLRQSRIESCPATANPGIDTGGPAPFTWAINRLVIGGGPGSAAWNAPDNSNLYRYVRQIRSPSTTLHLSDASSWVKGLHSWWGNCYWAFYEPAALHFATEHFDIGSSHYNWNGRANILYFDGHAAPLDYKAVTKKTLY